MKNTSPFQHYLHLWRTRFPRRRALKLKGLNLENAYCPDCRYCCGPQDSNTPYPMALLPEQLHPNLADDFHLLNKDTAYLDARGCKSLGPTGCRLPFERRPVSCGLFPLVPANGGLYLYKTCPAVFFAPLAQLGTLGVTAAQRLTARFSPQDLCHISLHLPEEVLAESYISLGIRLYGAGICPQASTA